MRTATADTIALARTGISRRYGERLPRLESIGLAVELSAAPFVGGLNIRRSATHGSDFGPQRRYGKDIQRCAGSLPRLGELWHRESRSLGENPRRDSVYQVLRALSDSRHRNADVETRVDACAYLGGWRGPGPGGRLPGEFRAASHRAITLTLPGLGDDPSGCRRLVS